MRTVLATFTYLEGTDAHGNDRFKRIERYLDYYAPLRDELGFERIHLIDNASDEPLVHKAITRSPFPNTTAYRFPDHLRSAWNYPYCWRALYHLQTLQAQYDKIIFCDSDGFVLTPRLADYIRGLQDGWTAFHNKRYNFPDSSLQILTQPAYPKFNQFCELGWLHRVGKQMETTLPFTRINTDYNTGRYGEDRMPQFKFFDYYGQAGPDFRPIFNKY